MGRGSGIRQDRRAEISIRSGVLARQPFRQGGKLRLRVRHRDAFDEAAARPKLADVALVALESRHRRNR